MNNIRSQTESSFREKGSKFIGFLFPVETKPAFEGKLTEIQHSYPDATHHCYGWRINPANINEFAQDDGEPSGTAGLPILNELKSFEVVNAGLIVVRYYGGTNLGRSGLIEAYGQTAAYCLQKADLKPINLVWKLTINFPYNEQNTIDQLKHQFNLQELDAKYTEQVTLLLACPVESQESLQQHLNQLEHRSINANFLEKSYI